jgi:hypothetical protein
MGCFLTTRVRLVFASVLVLAYVLLAATHWSGEVNVAYELFYRLITFVVVGIAAPVVWVGLNRTPAEAGSSVYRQLLVAGAILVAVVALFPDLRGPGGWLEIWAWVSHSVAAVGAAYFAYRFLPAFLKPSRLAERLIWGGLVILAVVPTARGAVVAGLSGMLTCAAGSFWPAAVLLVFLFGTFDCGVLVEDLSSTGPWLLAALVGFLLLVLLTLRGALAQNAGQQDEADPLGDVGDQVDEHQR